MGRPDPELEASGHRVVAPDLPCEDVDAGAAEYAQVVIDALDGSDDVIVVGHSLGGMTVPLIPGRTHVYLSAYVPQPGRALIDRASEAFGPGFADSAVRDELQRSYWPDPAAAAHDLRYPAESAMLAGRLRRQARKPSVEPSQLDALRTLRAHTSCAARTTPSRQIGSDTSPAQSWGCSRSNSLAATRRC